MFPTSEFSYPEGVETTPTFFFVDSQGRHTIYLGMSSKGRSSTRRRKGPFVILLVTSASLLALLLVGLFIAKAWVARWIEGDQFRQWLTQKAGQSLNAEVELEPLTIRRGTAQTNQFSAERRDKKGFSLLLEGISAEIDGISNQTILVPEIRVNRFDLRFPLIKEAESPPQSMSQTKPQVHQNSVESSPNFIGNKPESFLKKFLPNAVDVDTVSIASSRIIIGSESAPDLFLTTTRSEVIPDLGNQLWEVRVEGGKLVLKDRPPLSVHAANLRWNGKDLFLERCALGIFKEGHLESKGEISFTGEKNLDLTTDFSLIDVRDLIESPWRERLSGILQGTVRSSGSLSAPVYEGNVSLSEGVCQSLPILKTVAQYTRSDRFERLILDQASSEFRREGDTIALRNLVLQTDGLMRIEGSLDIVGEELDGNLEVGVTPGTMRWIPGAERLVFTEKRDGFLWTSMRLTGTTAEPKEDLSARLIAAAGRSIIEDAPAEVIDAAKEMLAPGSETRDDLKKEIMERGTNILKQLTPILNRK